NTQLFDFGLGRLRRAIVNGLCLRFCHLVTSIRARWSVLQKRNGLSAFQKNSCGARTRACYPARPAHATVSPVVHSNAGALPDRRRPPGLRSADAADAAAPGPAA